MGIGGGLNLLGFDGTPSFQVDPLGLACKGHRTGRLGERIAARVLEALGFTDIQTIKNRSNHGIDLAARDASGKLWFFEVKTSRGPRAPRLSKAQRRGPGGKGGSEAFVKDRLKKAAKPEGAWRRTDDPTTSDRADALLREVRDDGFNGQVIEITELDSGSPQVAVSDWE